MSKIVGFSGLLNVNTNAGMELKEASVFMFPNSEVTLTSERIILREVKGSDHADIHNLCYEDKDILRWVMRPNPFTMKAAEEWALQRIATRQRHEQITFCIIFDQTPVGVIYLGRFDCVAKRGEIAYWVARNFRGMNFGTEAVQLLTSWSLYQLNLVRVEILCPNENESSQQVALKSGYKYEGLLRSYRAIQGQHCDLKIYSAIAPQYERPIKPQN